MSLISYGNKYFKSTTPIKNQPLSSRKQKEAKEIKRVLKQELMHKSRTLRKDVSQSIDFATYAKHSEQVAASITAKKHDILLDSLNTP